MIKKIKLVVVSVAIALIGASYCSAEKSRILYINSYHKGYQWSDDIEKGLLKALGIKALADGTLDSSQSTVKLRIFRMDTKHNQSEAFKQKAALSAKDLIDQWQPNVVVASDDNAAKYLIAPYFKNSKTPVVFCGVNWDASVYGFPCSNVTGMVEVDPLLETIEILRPYAQGNRIGYLGADNISNQKKPPHHERVLGVQYTDGKLLADFNDWLQEYLRLQKTVDMLILFGNIGIKGWDREKARAFTLANTRIPTGSIDIHTVHLTLVGKVKIGEEQGHWAGRTALKILTGASPADFPIATNRYSRVFVNMRMAERLEIKFPMDLIERSAFVSEGN